jgi:hypothetical protein
MLIILLIFIMKFDYVLLILFEIYTVRFLVIILNNRSSYERRGANVYLIFFRYVIGIGVVMINNLIIIGIILLILGISKLPMYGLHI